MRLAQVAQHADDLDRASAFYTALLDTAPTARFDPPGLLFFDLEGLRLLLDDKAPSALLYLQVGSLEDAFARVPQAEVTTAPHMIFKHETDDLAPAGSEEWQAFLTDSEGNTVGLIELR
jgi:catechol 2,3-dioxygenase-like lactoylglutathione lyase family enzyme